MRRRHRGWTLERGGEADLPTTTVGPHVPGAAGRCCHADRAGPRSAGRLRRDPRLLRRAQPHRRQRGGRVRQRTPPDLARGCARDRLGRRAAVRDAPQRRPRRRRELGLHLGPLARDPRRCDRAVPLPAPALLPPPRRDDRLRPDRLSPLRALPRRAAAPARHRARRHGHAALRRVPRAPAARAHEPVRGVPQPARRLERPRRNRLADGGGEPRAAASRRCVADRDVARRRRHGEPLRDRRSCGRRRRSRRARDRDFPPGAQRRIYTASR